MPGLWGDHPGTVTASDGAFISPPAVRAGMRRTPAVRASLGAGAVITIAWLGYAFATDVLPVSIGPGFLPGALFLYVALVAVPFAIGAGATFLTLRHHVILPILAVAGYAAAPITVRLETGLIWVSILVVGPLVVVLALAETLLRGLLDRLANPPSLDGWRALSVGVMAAVGYTGVVALRAVLPLWRIETGVPPVLPPATQLAATLWYVLGVSLVLVGIPVALHRRFDLLAPVVGLLAYLLVDLAFVQPAVAEGTGLVVALLLGVWPTLAVSLAAVGALEWWLRDRRGEYDEGGGDAPDDGDNEGLTIEGGLFGDRV